MKRDIKRENQIIREIVEHVKQFYLWKIDNYDNYNEFYRNVYNEINDDSYNYFYDDNQKDPVMGVFCRYMTETFKNGSYTWFAEKDKKRIYSVEIKLLKAIKNADYERYVYEHIDEIENRVYKLHLKNRFEK